MARKIPTTPSKLTCDASITLGVKFGPPLFIAPPLTVM